MPSQNALAATLGISLVVLGSAAAYLLQKMIFARYRGKTRNAAEKDGR